jgi:hypothetical protein
MKIDGIDHSFHGKLSSTNNIDKNNGFKQIFDSKLAATDPTTITTPIDSRAGVLDQSDKILNLLDAYARTLTDPTMTLKDISPLVENIEKEVSSIEAEVSNKVHDDKEFGMFVKNLAVTANVAVFKFHRGDYV